jgi:hypothetical protein
MVARHRLWKKEFIVLRSEDDSLNLSGNMKIITNRVNLHIGHRNESPTESPIRTEHSLTQEHKNKKPERIPLSGT